MHYDHHQSSPLIKFKGDLSQEEQRCVLGDETVSGAFAHRQKVSSVFIFLQNLDCDLNVIQRGLVYELGVTGEEEMDETLVG